MGYGFVDLRSQETGFSILNPNNRYDKSQEVDIPFRTLVSDAFVKENVLYNVYQSSAPSVSRVLGGDEEDTISFDSIFDEIKDTPYFSHFDTLSRAKTQGEFNHMKSIIDRRMVAEQNLANAGFWKGLLANTIAGALDITSVLPVGQIYKAAKLGSSTLGFAARGAAANATASAFDEVVLNKIQDERTVQESINNVLASAVLGGALGGFSGFVSNARKESALAEINNVLNDSERAIVADEKGNLSEFVGPIKPTSYNPFDMQIVSRAGETAEQTFKLESAKGLPDPLLKLFSYTPIVKGLRSPFQSIKRMTNDIYSHNLITNRNSLGRTSGVTLESQIFNLKSEYIDTALASDRLYKKYANREKGSSSFLSREQLNEEVSKLIRSNSFSHSIPEVAEIAKMNKQVIDYFKDIAVDMGLLPENVSPATADGYLTRMFNKNKIRNNPQEFLSRLEKTFVENNERLKLAEPEIKRIQNEIDSVSLEIERVKKSKGDVESLNEKLSSLEKELNDIAPRELRDSKGKIRTPFKAGEEKVIARSTMDKILGLEYDQRTNGSYFGEVDIAGSIDPLHQRVLMVPDSVVEDFLENNITTVMDNYIQRMATVIGMEQFFRARGGTSATGLTTLFNELESDIKPKMDALLKKSREAKTQKEKQKIGRQIKKLTNEQERAQQWIKDSVELMGGVYARPESVAGQITARTLRVMRNLNVMRLLGGQTISSLPDMAMPIFRHGFKNYVQDGILPVIRNLQASKLSKDQLRDFKVGLESAHSSRYMDLQNGPDAFYEMNAFENAVERATRYTGKLTLSNIWTDTQSRIAGHMSQARMIRNMDKYLKTGKLSKADLEHLSVSGIDKEMYKRIMDQFKLHGNVTDGSYISNWQRWEDPEAQQVFKQAVQRDVFNTIIRPGKGDRAFFANDKWGSTILQFKSFGMAANNKIVLSALQRKDAAVFAGLMSMLSIGSMAYVVRSMLAGRDIDWSPENIFLQAMDLSGVTGLLMDGFGMVDQFFGISSNGLSRYVNRGNLGSLGGPTVGYVEDAATSLGKIIGYATGQEDLTENDLLRMKRLFPYQNLFYIRYLTDQATVDAGNAAGLTG